MDWQGEIHMGLRRRAKFRRTVAKIWQFNGF